MLSSNLQYLLPRIITKTASIMLVSIGISSLILSGGNMFTLTVIRFPLMNLFIPSLYYVGYPLSFIIFGAFIGIFYYKFGNLSLPIFLLSYIIWEIYAQGLRAIGNTKLEFFSILLLLAIPCLIILWKRITVNISLTLFILYWVIGQIFPMIYPPTNAYNEPINETVWCILIYVSLRLKIDSNNKSTKTGVQ